MRNVYLVTILEFIINAAVIKQIESLGYWPIKDSICVNTVFIYHSLRAQSLRPEMASWILLVCFLGIYSVIVASSI